MSINSAIDLDDNELTKLMILNGWTETLTRDEMIDRVIHYNLFNLTTDPQNKETEKHSIISADFFSLQRLRNVLKSAGIKIDRRKNHEKLVQLVIKHHLIDPLIITKPPLVDRFMQPFPRTIGMQSNGLPNNDFKAFVNSDEAYYTITPFMSISNNPMHADVLYKYLGINYPTCNGHIYLYGYDLVELEAIIEDYPYIEDLVNGLRQQISDIGENSLNIRYTDEIVPDKLPVSIIEILEENRTLDMLNLKKNYMEKKISECLNSGYDQLRFQILYAYSAKTAGGRVGGQNLLHTSQVIIDKQSLIGYIVDPSFQNKSTLLDRVNNESLEIFFRHHIDDRFTMRSIDFSSCQSRNLQGVNMLCSVWTTYLYFLIFSNPGMTIEYIYYIFSQYTQYDRDIIILQFMYYIYLKGILNLPQFAIEDQHLQYINATRNSYPLPRI